MLCDGSKLPEVHDFDGDPKYAEAIIADRLYREYGVRYIVIVHAVRTIGRAQQVVYSKFQNEDFVRLNGFLSKQAKLIPCYPFFGLAVRGVAQRRALAVITDEATTLYHINEAGGFQRSVAPSNPSNSAMVLRGLLLSSFAQGSDTASAEETSVEAIDDRTDLEASALEGACEGMPHIKLRSTRTRKLFNGYVDRRAKYLAEVVHQARASDLLNTGFERFEISVNRRWKLFAPVVLSLCTVAFLTLAYNGYKIWRSVDARRTNEARIEEMDALIQQNAAVVAGKGNVLDQIKFLHVLRSSCYTEGGGLGQALAIIKNSLPAGVRLLGFSHERKPTSVSKPQTDVSEGLVLNIFVAHEHAHAESVADLEIALQESGVEVSPGTLKTEGDSRALRLKFNCALMREAEAS